MRRPSDLPRRPRKPPTRLRRATRWTLLGVAALLIFVVVFGRALARFYVDFLWYDALGQSGVFWSMLWARVTLFAMFFGAFALVAGVNVFVADRLAPSLFPVNVHPFVERFHDLFGRRLRLYRYLVAGFIGLVVALPTTTQWQSWLLYRNSQSFGTPDARFGADVGFYVFELPFLAFVLDWCFFAMIIVLLLTVVTHVLNGGLVFASPIPTVSQAMKGHVAVLLAVIAALKGADYWLRRYELTNVRRGFVQGPTYSVVNAQLPALLLLAVVAIVVAGLYLSTLKTQAWRIPLVASGVWLVLAIVGGYVYPAAVQSLVVRPNQKSREEPFIEHNVTATRAAMGIDDVTEIDVSYGPLTGPDIEGDTRPLERVRLLNPVEAETSFQRAEGEEAGLIINDLDVDRYEIDGELQQVLVAARELDLDGAANQSWQGRHLINTHGCGLVMAPASQVRANSDPDFHDVELERPQIYFSPDISGWAVAGTDETEQGCGADEGPYLGDAGVAMSSWLRQAAFGLAFMDYNLVGSGAVRSGNAQMLWNRNVRDRVEKLAPFLSYDGDPYPVQYDGGVVWVIDAYTSTSRYPYAEAVGNDVQLLDGSGIPRDANYIRNSVKAVVDAYDGEVTLYVMDEADDPIIEAWWSAFPDLFTPGDQMPDELREHLRYPEDLFRVQTNVYSKYRLAPEDFFERTGAWSVAQSPSGAAAETPPAATESAARQAGGTSELATESSNARFIPYYTLFDGVQGRGVVGDEDFVLLRPFVPFSREDDRTELTAFMTVSSDVDSYGALTVFTTEGGRQEGPRQVAIAVDADRRVAEAVTNVNQAGGATKVRFGDLQLVPIADGIVWTRPFYVATQQSGSRNPVVSYQRIIVVYDGSVAMSDTIGGALAELFPSLGEDFDIGERVGSPDEESEIDIEPIEVTPDDDDAPVTSDPGADVPDHVLRQVFDLLNEADAALPDLGAYQDKVDEATRLLERYLPDAGAADAGGVATTVAED